MHRGARAQPGRPPPPRHGADATHVGRERGVCGCCTVLPDGQPVHSSLLFAVQADGAEVLTVEGLSRKVELHPLQQAFREELALQCAACMEGMMHLAARGLRLDQAELRLRNLLRRHEFPYTSVTKNLYNSGSYAECLEVLLEKSGYAALRGEQAALRERGICRGTGLCCFIEITGPGAPFYGMGGAPISGQDGTTVRVDPSSSRPP